MNMYFLSSDTFKMRSSVKNVLKLSEVSRFLAEKPSTKNKIVVRRRERDGHSERKILKRKASFHLHVIVKCFRVIL